MSLQAILFLALQLSVFLTVLTIGMETTGSDLRYVLSKPARLFRALLAINILGPIVAVLVCRTFLLHPAVIVGLVTLAVAPVSNMFPKSMAELVSQGHVSYARGLFFASTVLSVIVTPLAVEMINVLFGSDAHVSPVAVAQVVLGTVLLPLSLGLLLGKLWPAIKRWGAGIQKVSGLVLLVCGLVIIAAAWSTMGSLLRTGTVSAIAIIAFLGLLAGHVLGGPDEDDRTVLAEATISRHPGVAIVVANLTNEPLAPIGVLLAVLVSAIAVMPYTQWRKKRLALSAPATARSHRRAH